MAYAVIGHIAVQGSINGTTSGSLDTSGADLLVAVMASVTGSGATFSDSKSNSWTSLTAQTTSDGQIQMFYVRGGTVGTGHTFSTAGTSVYAGCAVLALSGSNAVPFDVQNGSASNSGGATWQPGSVTPGAANSIVITGIQCNSNTDFNTAAAIDSSFTISDRIASAIGASYAIGLAYLIETSIVAQNPTWSFTSGGGPVSAVIATFKVPASGATVPAVASLPLLGVQ